MRPLLTLALLLFALPAAALEATTPTKLPAQKTPFPDPERTPEEALGPWDFSNPVDDPWRVPDDPRAEEPVPRVSAAEAFPPQSGILRRSQRLDDPLIAPTLAVSASAHHVKGDDSMESSSIDVWFGGRFHPMVGSTAPFLALGVEVNLRGNPRVDPRTSREERVYAELVPELRLGVAPLRSPHDEFANAVFPEFEVYAIAGWRVANDVNGQALRLGAGASVPYLLVESLRYNTLAPCMLEVTMDVDSVVSGEREFALRFGWQF